MTMDTPICDFVRAYAAGDSLRLHMPGHKGRSILGIEALDITEIPGADVLYSAQGIIRRSEENAASLFGTARTLYSAEGSTLSIRAMVYLASLYAKAEGKPLRIAAGRNAHKSFLTAAALLDMEIDWVYPEKWEGIVSCGITAELLETYLSAAEEKPAAVYLTSPDYLGNMADIRGISQVCRRHGALLLVDNAHGAYLRFLPRSAHPMDLGADICCDSAHKTLPVLTGGGYLHISRSAPGRIAEQAEKAMSLFASTSPSYLILQSLDRANPYLAEDYRERLAAFCEKTEALKGKLKDAGYTLVGEEPLKLTVAARSRGYTGIELSRRLSEENIVCEFSDPDYTVMMLTPESGEDALYRVERALLSLGRGSAPCQSPPLMARPKKALSPRAALLSPSREMNIGACRGKVLAVPTVSCPPAVPIVVCGEVIDPAAIRLFRYYGIETCTVVDPE